ncbi:chaperone protein dnaJ 8, chloroplastic-like isoform X2 [Nicotiana sylvestris]|uniref:chaperone protein dnaJ 8, chloroplastic-like isoform X2 n=1 Tax=Nicotiana sylvestris TaxID=4096 RepID=UPI00388CE40F
MATAIGMLGNVGGCGSASASWIRLKNCSKKKTKGENVRFKVSCVYSPSVSDPYKTLRIQPGASESEVRKAFRQLALQVVMSNLRGETKRAEMEIYEEYDDDDSMRGVNDPDWDMWEEWMGWEGAGIRD